MQLSIHLLPYAPAELIPRFSHLLARPWGQLLHSGSANHPDSRFDILVSDPFATLVTRGLQTRVTAPDGILVTRDDPLELLQQQMDKWFPKAIVLNDDLPFLGGALGAFSYDLGRRFEKLPALALADIEFPEMALGLYDWALVADHLRSSLTMICHGDPKSRLNRLTKQREITNPTQPFCLTSPWKSNMDSADYANKFACIQEHLRRGDCYQVNLARRFSANYQGDEWYAFQRLIQHNLAPFSAFLRFPFGSVLSLSPERFIHLSQGGITSRPIKGTCARHPDVRQDRRAAAKLASSAKDRAENVMIVDLLRNDLGRVALPGTVRVPELCAVESFPAVHHLVSTIKAELATENRATDLLKSTFPGGSITGAPKIRAMEIIEQLEPHRRSIYCGSIGYLSCCGTMDSNIAIRTLLAQRGEMHCWSGGGIVIDSEVEAEFQETIDKIGRILPILSATGPHV